MCSRWSRTVHFTPVLFASAPPPSQHTLTQEEVEPSPSEAAISRIDQRQTLCAFTVCISLSKTRYFTFKHQMMKHKDQPPNEMSPPSSHSSLLYADWLSTALSGHASMDKDRQSAYIHRIKGSNSTGRTAKMFAIKCIFGSKL